MSDVIESTWRQAERAGMVKQHQLDCDTLCATCKAGHNVDRVIGSGRKWLHMLPNRIVTCDAAKLWEAWHQANYYHVQVPA